MRYVVFAVALLAQPALAGGPVVEGVATRKTGEAWAFDVTVRHDDTGWDHYADGWVVESADGTELGYRKLHHPHETEQPFTRSLSGVVIPQGVTKVFVRAHDSVHGWGERVPVPLN